MLRSARARETAQSEAALMRLATFSLDNAHRTTNYTGTPSFIARPSLEMSGTLLICSEISCTVIFKMITVNDFRLGLCMLVA